MKELVDTIKKSGSSKILHQINTSLSKHFHEHSHILYDIRTLLGNDKTITYLEIGSYIGSSAALMLKHPFPSNIICIDPLILHPSHFKGTKSQEATLQDTTNTHNIHNYPVTIHKKFSHDADLLQQLKGLKIDILFIDGDHRYKGVVDDWKNYEPLVASGGFIVFDDYLDAKSSPQVRKAVDDIVAKLDAKKYKVIGSLPNFQKAFSPVPKLRSNEFIIRKL